MTPRLTPRGRVSRCNTLNLHDAMGVSRSSADLRNSRPSPAERLRQRRKARASAMRNQEIMKMAWNKRHESYTYDVLPQSRGTTTGQLVAWHLEAEENHAPVVGRTDNPEQDHV